MSQSIPFFEVLSIPELIDAIQVFLTPHDLAQCTVVSKTFQALFTPVLWKTITIKTHRQHLAFTTVPEVQDALVRHATHIRAIYLRTCKSLEPFFQVDPTHLKLLHTLAFPWSAESYHALLPLASASSSPSSDHPQDLDDHPVTPASSVYAPQAHHPPLSQEDQQGILPMPKISPSGALDKVVSQKDWLRAKGMFPGQELIVQNQFQYLQELKKRQRYFSEFRQRALNTAAAAATVTNLSGSSSSSSSSSAAAGSTTANSTATASPFGATS
ncbi:hypothetical protein BGZ95_004540, partial [Linnemannia exigua]